MTDDAFTLAIQELRAGRLHEAQSLLQQALTAQPDRLEALEALANLCHRLGDMSGAEEMFRRAVAVASHMPHLHASLGAVLAAQDRLDDAAAALRQAVLIRPDDPQILVHLAVVLNKQGLHDQAIDAYRKAIALQPHFPEAYNNLGNVLRRAARRDEAAAAFQQALAQKPDFAEAQNNLAVLLRDAGRFEEAMAVSHAAITLRPSFPEAHYNLGLTLTMANRHADAVGPLRRAVELHPAYLEAHFALATALQNLHELDAALSAYRRCVELDPALTNARVEIGYLQFQQGRLEEAMATHRQTLDLHPNCAGARLALGMGSLLKGDFASGWPAYEARRQIESLGPRHPPLPRWTGDALGGRRILLHSEQGLGDVIHFVRYAALVRKRGGRVIVQSYKQLRRLLTGQLGIERFVSDTEPLPDCEVQCPLLSLPYVLGTTPETFPADVPYLSADPERVQQWYERVAAAPRGLRVGLVWAGGGKHRFDRERSLSLAQLAPLAQVKPVQFFSLQIGQPGGQVKAPPKGMEIHDHSDELLDLVDTAALIANMDLVICVDTAVAHLAGALGKPVWLLLQFLPDWRWMLDRADTWWYPTMRLFRQPAHGDWESAIQNLRRELASHVAKRG
ncbi:MAG TPA: tetratricopeptide repeat protein [Tepidisphaeraceae bacterium]|nr:tetratricopeptide repeat protein [Tepidisphaeraceae bacterium]